MTALPPPLSLHLPDEAATAALAARFAPRLGAGDCLLLSGPVGAGKSAFARALIRARLGDPAAEVPSPSFTLVQTYEDAGTEIWHCDLYRLTRPDEVLELGLSEAFDSAICLVEWPDRLGPDAPDDALALDFAALPDGSHRVTIHAPGTWPARLGPCLA